MNLPRPSFRQLLVLAFVLVAALLAGTAVRGLVTLERLLEQGRAGAERALALNSAAEGLAEQVVAMERAARQYLVLGDPVLRANFERAADEAAQKVDQLAPALAAGQAQAWAGGVQRVRDALDGGGADRALVDEFRALDRLQAVMADQVSRQAARRSADLQAQTEASRRALGQQVLATVLLALALALALGWWLSRPLQRVEAAIVGLGENRLGEPVRIRGPADVHRIARRLDWLRQRLTETEAAQARFLRHVSHDLKTPLAALREGVALLADGTAGPLVADQREIVRILGDNSATLQRRIEDLLRWNATAFAAQRVRRQAVDVAALVQARVDGQRLQWRAKGLTVATDGAPLTAMADPELLGSAVDNLLANAIRFSPREATIRIAWRASGGTLAITVTDQGPGVAAADRERIFEPFYRGQVQPADALPGTGIGLSIVAESVRAHGGRVMLERADPGRPGAAFCIELPHALPD